MAGFSLIDALRKGLTGGLPAAYMPYGTGRGIPVSSTKFQIFPQEIPWFANPFDKGNGNFGAPVYPLVVNPIVGSITPPTDIVTYYAGAGG